MGCDIHLYVEGYCEVMKHWEPLDKWTFDVDCDWFNVEREDSFYYSRDYWLFNQMAGVRSYGEQPPVQFEPRGLPADVSKPIKALSEHWDTDGHSHSFLYLCELEQIRRETEEWQSFLVKLKALPERYQKPYGLRAVFFFDN